MARILNFPSTVTPVRVSTRTNYNIAVWIRDEHRPKETRWRVQFAIQNAAGFGALSGFTDKKAVGGGLHRFSMKAARWNTFFSQIESLLRNGRIRLRVNGQKLDLKPRRIA